MIRPYHYSHWSWSWVASATWYWRQAKRLAAELGKRLLCHLIIWAIVPNATGHVAGTNTAVDGWIF